MAKRGPKFPKLASAEPPQKSTGRKRIPIDGQTVANLARIGCTQEEIASALNCSVDTLARRFADALKEGKHTGNRALRRLQWKLAKRGNVTMAIWLGKQLLGQKDRTDVTSADEAIKPTVVKVLSGVSMDEI